MAVFNAVSSSPRQLFLLLRCISFVPKVQVTISSEGLRFSAEESRVMQGLLFLDKDLFTTYHYNPTQLRVDSSEDEQPVPVFQISLPALLETLQILVSPDSASNSSRDRFNRDSTTEPRNGAIRGGAPTNAFDTRILDMPAGLCRFHYEGPGDSLRLILEEANVITTANLTTYEPEEAAEDIPFNRGALALKIIMRPAWLYDALNELGSTGAERVTLSAIPDTADSPKLALSAAGPLGSATVEFAKDAPQLLETYQVPKRTRNSYKYSMLKAAARAMAIAAKVSIRGDDQDVLSLQFMIEVHNDIRGQPSSNSSTGGGAAPEPAVSFVDFRFVPYVPEELAQLDDEDGSSEGGNGISGNSL
ncbi:MAG: ssDNA endodeoxyribonuclease [Alyxoria varia]|nr:MAG: ssDNA endodeoxyribonuclease [Alyxoria varia]